jgi:hypothetical protein
MSTTPPPPTHASIHPQLQSRRFSGLASAARAVPLCTVLCCASLHYNPSSNCLPAHRSTAELISSHPTQLSSRGLVATSIPRNSPTIYQQRLASATARQHAFVAVHVAARPHHGEQLHDAVRWSIAAPPSLHTPPTITPSRLPLPSSIPNKISILTTNNTI